MYKEISFIMYSYGINVIVKGCEDRYQYAPEGSIWAFSLVKAYTRGGRGSPDYQTLPLEARKVLGNKPYFK